MKDLITPTILGIVLAFGAIFGVDAEVARQDRAECSKRSNICS